MKVICIFILLIYTQGLLSQSTWKRNYDLIHYRLRLDVNEKTRTFNGDITIKLLLIENNVELIKLDATDLKISEVKLRGQKLKFQLKDNKLAINLTKEYSTDDTLELIINYSATNPKAGMEFVESEAHKPYQNHSMYSMGYDRYNHYWFPCYDNPDDVDFVTSELIITVPEYLKVIAGGELLKTEKRADGKITYHWYEYHPHATYNICLFITDYKEVKEVWKGIELSYYVKPEIADTLLKALSITPKAMEFISSILEYPYPFEKYAQAFFENSLCNSNISATTLNGTILPKEGAETIVHELAHEWFGTVLTIKNACSVWLAEGFVDFIAGLFVGQGKQNNFFNNRINTLYSSIIQNDNHPEISPPILRCDSLYSLYNSAGTRGEAVLHMLRNYLGEDPFWKGIRHWIKKHAFRVVDTDDFRIAMEETTGINLYLFFKEFVYGHGHRKYNVHHRWDGKLKKLVMNVNRIDTNYSSLTFLPIPVDVEISVNDMMTTHHLTLSKLEEEFYIQADTAPQMVIFNKGPKFLMEVLHEKSTDEWLYQMSHAENEADRLDAMFHIKEFTDSEKVGEVLVQVVLHDPSERVRNAADMWLMFFKKKLDE